MTVFSDFERELAAAGETSALEALATQLKGEERFHQLFDVRLIQARRRLGLPIIGAAAIDEIAEPSRTELEDAYIAACREVGELLLDAGNLREAWMYLRPTGDRERMAVALANTAPAEDNIEQLVEIALNEGIDPPLGYSLVLAHYGTCNAITMFDSVAYGRPRAIRSELAAQLIRHVHRELIHSLRSDIERREGQAPPEATPMSELMAGRDELFGEMNYHLDTSHLAAAVRLGRLVEEPGVLRLAAELAQYGERLDKTYQYAGEAPFRDLYPTSRLFFEAQLGERVDQAIDYFRQQAAATDVYEQGSGPAEAYIALLARLQRYREAMESSLRFVPPGTTATGFAPTLMELAALAGDFGAALTTFREREDIVNFAAAALAAREAKREG